MHLIATLAIVASGLHGIVMKGPTQPVCRTGPAPRLYRTRSTATGAYRITLPAGYYTVTTAEKIGITRNLRPQRVHVRAAHQDALNFHIDTGIR